MEQIKIAVRVSLDAAVARGEARYGDAEVALSDADVAGLSVDAKAEIGRYVVGGLGKRLSVEHADVPHAVAALDQAGRFAADEKARPAREREARIIKALAMPDSDWIGLSYDEYYCRNDDGQYASAGHTTGKPTIRRSPGPLYESDMADPRIVERLEIVRTRTLNQLVREWESHKQAADRVIEAERVKAAAEREKYDAAIRSLATREDDLARAAKDGYSVERAVLDRLTERLAESVADAVHSIDTSCWKSPQDRASPSPEAFTLLDRVTAAVRSANERLPHVIGEWQVSRIVRVDTCPHRGEEHKITAVLATLVTPTAEREVTFSYETQTCSHDAD